MEGDTFYREKGFFVQKWATAGAGTRSCFYALVKYTHNKGRKEKARAALSPFFNNKREPRGKEGILNVCSGEHATKTSYRKGSSTTIYFK